MITMAEIMYLQEQEGRRRYLAGEPFKTSTGICGSLTYGYGRLDDNGYWEFPVSYYDLKPHHRRAVDHIESWGRRGWS